MAYYRTRDDGKHYWAGYFTAQRHLRYGSHCVPCPSLLVPLENQERYHTMSTSASKQSQTAFSATLLMLFMIFKEGKQSSDTLGIADAPRSNKAGNLANRYWNESNTLRILGI